MLLNWYREKCQGGGRGPWPQLSQQRSPSSTRLLAPLPLTAPQTGLKARFAQDAGLLAAGLYLSCHAYTIPVLTVGPSWVVWPRLDDFATLPLVVAAVVFGSRKARSHEWQPFSRLLMWANLLTLVSFSLMVIHAGPGEREINTGLYQILRLVEYSAVFFCFSRLAASQRAIALMLRVIAGVWAFIAAVALANFFGWLPSVRLASHLLHDAGSAGPWTKYAFVSRDVVLGPLGYNQMYIANQMTLLGVLLAFGKRRTALVRSVILFLTFIIVFLSGSRAGLVAFLCALVMALVAARWRVLLLLGMAGALLLILSAAPPRWVDLAEPAIERQGALARLEEAGSYSGRVEIWEEKLSYLRQDPSVLLFGVGWGGIGTTGDNAHMLPLQVLMETGLFGLLFFLFLFRALLRALARSGVMGQGIAVATLGLFVASLTQETFYPVPATGSFLGLYLALCGLSAARKDDETVRSGGSA